MSRAIATSLRAVAVGIALLAAIDPSITTERRARPTISVIAVDPVADQPRADSVARALGGTARVVDAPFALVDATVLVGNVLPASLPASSPAAVPASLRRESTPVFAVTDDVDRANVRVSRLEVPAFVPLHASTEIRVTMAVSDLDQSGDVNAARANVPARELLLTLRSGKALLDRRALRIDAGDTTVRAMLAFVPARTGAVPLRVEVSLSRAAGTPERDATDIEAFARADALVTVQERAWSVLVYDPRPSWMSTFVRRALERDPRFAVTSRIVTSRAISTIAGRAPVSLADPSALAPFDVVIVGAPEELRPDDIRGVASFLRRRGGSAVLLFDTRARGSTDLLTGVDAWSMRTLPSAVPLRTTVPTAAPRTDSVVATPPLVAAQLLAPSTPAAGTEPILMDATGRPIVWQTSVGPGQLLVSGALDAWRHRDVATSAFDRTWQRLIGDAAAASLPPLIVSVLPALLAPTDSASVRVVLRDAALAVVADSRNVEGNVDVQATVSAHLEWTEGDSTRREPVRLWPDGAVGSLRGTIRLPQLPAGLSVPFDATLVVDAGGYQSKSAVRVDTDRRRARVDGRDLLRRYVAARGGAAATMSTLPALADAIGRVVRGAPAATRWYPMRSVWWLLPLTLALAGEWWLRRRRGLA